MTFLWFPIVTETFTFKDRIPRTIGFIGTKVVRLSSLWHESQKDYFTTQAYNGFSCHKKDKEGDIWTVAASGSMSPITLPYAKKSTMFLPKGVEYGSR